MSINIANNKPIPTSPVAQPYRVRLEGGPCKPSEIVIVRDDVEIGARRVVRSAHGDGFWHIASTADLSALPVATFQPHHAATFIAPRS